jgi:hypothetical protein
MAKAKLPVPFSLIPFDDWDDFLILARNIQESDLFVLISARKGTASYTQVLDNLPAKLEKHFAANSRVIIFPQQYKTEEGLEVFDDINTDPFNKGIESIQKIGKEIGKIFK